MKVSVDVIVGTGLVLALLTSIFNGGDTELQKTLATGLIGFLGGTVIRNTSNNANSNNNRKDDVK